MRGVGMEGIHPTPSNRRAAGRRMAHTALHPPQKQNTPTHARQVALVESIHHPRPHVFYRVGVATTRFTAERRATAPPALSPPRSRLRQPNPTQPNPSFFLGQGKKHMFRRTYVNVYQMPARTVQRVIKTRGKSCNRVRVRVWPYSTCTSTSISRRSYRRCCWTISTIPWKLGDPTMMMSWCPGSPLPRSTAPTQPSSAG